MIQTKHAAFGAFVLLAVSAAALAQDTPSRRGPGSDSIEAAREALGLTDEQVEEIRGIRRERPPRGTDREQFRSWRDDQRSKLQDVLTDDQKSKLAELEAQRRKMRALAGAAILGLAEIERGDRSRSDRTRRGFGADRSGFGPGPGWDRRGRGSGQFNRGFGGRGRRFGPRGGFSGGPWQGQRNRGGRGRNRD